jgi:hypothetical protein
MSAKTTSQLQLTPKRMPAMRPIVKLSRTALARLARLADGSADPFGDHGAVLTRLFARVRDQLLPLCGRNALPAPTGLVRKR